MDIFSGKVAIVTGGASGIGRALGEELARRGANVVLGDIQSDQLDSIVNAITQSGQSAQAVTLDVAEFEAVKAIVDDTVSRYGRLDYIFNNAGIAIAGEARDFTIEDWRNVININLYGVVHGVQAAYPVMVNQGSGHIVNTASIEGLVPFPSTISYAASKFGVVGLSNALRIEGADLGVKVSVVCPGYIKTQIFETSKVIKLDREKLLEALPDRLGITPEKCATLILRGVARNKAFIVVTGFAKTLWIIASYQPSNYTLDDETQLNKVAQGSEDRRLRRKVETGLGQANNMI
jgi:NAD(P)-dependent dehydrogenase (short-subunit alcohol dehydrogenase family)